jgi:hypothetical protein
MNSSDLLSQIDAAQTHLDDLRKQTSTAEIATAETAAAFGTTFGLLMSQLEELGNGVLSLAAAIPAAFHSAVQTAQYDFQVAKNASASVAAGGRSEADRSAADAAAIADAEKAGAAFVANVVPESPQVAQTVAPAIAAPPAADAPPPVSTAPPVADSAQPAATLKTPAELLAEQWGKPAPGTIGN